MGIGGEVEGTFSRVLVVLVVLVVVHWQQEKGKFRLSLGYEPTNCTRRLGGN